MIVLRRTRPDLDRPFRTPGVPWLPMLSAASSFALMASLSLDTWIRLVIWMAIGLPSTAATGIATARCADEKQGFAVKRRIGLAD